MSKGLFLPNRISSSSTGFEYRQFSSEIKTTQSENSSASNSPFEQYHYLISKFDELDNRVKKVEKVSNRVDCFTKQSIILQKICIIVICILPLIVSAAAAGIVWCFSTDQALITCAKWYLGILGFSGIIDLVVIFVTERFRSARISDLERRVDRLEK